MVRNMTRLGSVLSKRKVTKRKTPVKRRVTRRKPTELVIVKRQTKSRVTRNNGGRTARAIRSDKRQVALHPGKRRSATGRTYWETRDNRSDKDKRKRL